MAALDRAAAEKEMSSEKFILIVLIWLRCAQSNEVIVTEVVLLLINLMFSKLESAEKNKSFWCKIVRWD